MAKSGTFASMSITIRRLSTSLKCWRALVAVVMLGFVGLLVAGSDGERTLMSEVEARLQVANETLTKALLGPFSFPACEASLSAAVKNVNEAQLLLSSNEVQRARGKVLVARESSAECLNYVAAIEDSSNQRVLYSMILEADGALDEVVSLVPISTDWAASSNVSLAANPKAEFEPQGYNCPPNQVDGTVCQFSSCALGRNLVSCSIGFAKGVLGGYNGQWYVVTSDQDHPDNPWYGTLRYGCNLARKTQGGVWIAFSRDMKIELKAMLWVHSHTTIDGRGFNITIHSHSVVLSGAKQVILENIQVNSVRGGDTVHIFADCWKVWVDHVTSFGGDLGLVSVVQGSTDVTISNSKLSNYNFNMLLGASDNDYQDKNMRVTVYRNHFVDSMQRMPHCRWGWCHVANNLYTNWGYYAIGARVNARVKTENNVFYPSRVNEVTPWHPGAQPGSFDFSARIESTGDVLMNGATYHQFLSATHDVRPPYPNGEYPPIIPAYKVTYLVSSCAGAQTPWILPHCQKASYA
ncbi:unnamed protein product [Calypogeia fissa]